VAPDEEVDRWWARAEAGRESRARVPEWITPRRGEKRAKRKQARGGEEQRRRDTGIRCGVRLTGM
jgi:hypothetical protein